MRVGNPESSADHCFVSQGCALEGGGSFDKGAAGSVDRHAHRHVATCLADRHVDDHAALHRFPDIMLHVTVAPACQRATKNIERARLLVRHAELSCRAMHYSCSPHMGLTTCVSPPACQHRPPDAVPSQGSSPCNLGGGEGLGTCPAVKVKPVALERQLRTGKQSEALEHVLLSRSPTCSRQTNLLADRPHSWWHHHS